MSHPQLLHLACILLLCPAWSVARQRYDRYRLFDYKPLTQRHLTIIAELQERHAGDGLLDFWREARGLNSTGTFMASPRIAEGLARGLLAAGVRLNRRSTNVQRLVDLQRRQNRHHRFFMRTPFSRPLHEFYMRFSEITAWLQKKVQQCIPPIACQLQTIAHGYEGRKLLLLRITKNRRRPTIWIDGGIHAREWITPATTIYLIDKLLKNNDEASNLLDRFNFAILPVLNPDGYEYSHTHTRFWRKNRRPSSSKWGCIGVDLNRNFGYGWGGLGASDRSCSYSYHGPKAFSEPESLGVEHYLRRNKENIILYLSLHSFGQYILIPYTDRRGSYPPNKRQLMNLGNSMAMKMQLFSGRMYNVGTGADLLYLASGGSMDYARGTLNIPYSYTIELPDTGQYAFFLPPHYIKEVGEEIWIGLKEIGRAV